MGLDFFVFALPALSVFAYGWTWMPKGRLDIAYISFAASYSIITIQYIYKHKYVSAAVFAAYTAFFIWLWWKFRKNRKGRKKLKELGEKSKAKIQEMVKTMKKLKPSPIRTPVPSPV